MLLNVLLNDTGLSDSGYNGTLKGSVKGIVFKWPEP